MELLQKENKNSDQGERKGPTFLSCTYPPPSSRPKMLQRLAMTREGTLLVGCDSSVADCSDRTLDIPPPSYVTAESGQEEKHPGRHVNRNLGFCFTSIFEWEGKKEGSKGEGGRNEINRADAFLWSLDFYGHASASILDHK
ncbi:hypothetical protein TNCT_325671 [Trichonephila clavata]|uniref:Uncharacterized protein n=1 Tax=Trichonephila clavata TaxID=2740835 RepID=A0A8X6H5B4_TRICU|nr:hypothetical protein TNCT_325671 [Trichonephila clavata]